MSSLIKLGPLNINRERWLDANGVFPIVHVVELSGDSEPELGSGFIYHYLPQSMINVFLIKVCRFSRKRKWCFFFARIAIFLLRLINTRWVNDICDIDSSEVLASYNDFDDSGILTIILGKKLKNSGKRLTRSYKETRPEYDAFEEKAFRLSDRIVLNADECIDFFKMKYGQKLFYAKEMLTNLDEDWLSEAQINGVEIREKLSAVDKRLHAVILAGRVMSDQTDARSGSRLFYLPMIQAMIDAGIVVHLHTLRVIPDSNGVDRYALLEKDNPDFFHIESPLNMEGEEIYNALSILSQYDLGILHNYIEGTSNTAFDQYNIAHRYYEYQAAKVIPILEEGKTIVMERMMREGNSGILYRSFSDIANSTGDITFHCPSFKQYIESLFSDK